MIGREEGVENQSIDRSRMTTTETEMTMSTERGVGNDDRTMMMTTEMDMTTSNAIENSNSLECDVCKKHFKNIRGLKIHQGRICRNKTKKRGSPDRKTRSKSSQDANHRGLITATPESEIVQIPSPNESLGKKEKIMPLWPIQF